MVNIMKSISILLKVTNIHGSKLMLCIWWDQVGVVYYELLQPIETIGFEASVETIKSIHVYQFSSTSFYKMKFWYNNFTHIIFSLTYQRKFYLSLIIKTIKVIRYSWELDLYYQKLLWENFTYNT